MKNAILLMGPTATGKTELALRLAEFYPIEIISVDSALIYKDMNIGTAKPSQVELNRIPHHLINILTPLESYSVARFLQDCVHLIGDISERGRIPLLVGGTMMYYNALINGLSELPISNPMIRAELEVRGLNLGFEVLHQELAKVDAIAAKRIMPLDKQRIIRALEVYQLTSIPMTELQQRNKQSVACSINFVPLVIMPNNRDILHKRINQRFENMLEQGLLMEVEALKLKYPELTCDHTSMRSVGYHQVWRHLERQINYIELLEMGKAATRQLAKRQLTWLKSINIPNEKYIINLDEDYSLATNGMLIGVRHYIDKLFRT